MTSNEVFEIECSDEESYFDPTTVYRQVNGKRIWEPRGDIISELYSQLESSGGVFREEDFDWQNPGRISPSELKESLKKNDADAGLEDDTDKANQEQTKTEFDFDNEFDDEQTSFDSSAKVTVKSRTSQALKKPTTDLSAVMRNIKKYQK